MGSRRRTGPRSSRLWPKPHRIGSCPRPRPRQAGAAVQAASSPSDLALEKPAVRLAGLWKLEAAADALRRLAVSPSVDDVLRAEALDALAAIGGQVGRSRIEVLAGRDQPMGTRILAVAALAKLDLEAAAVRAAEILAQPAALGRDLTPLLAAFLNRQGGAESSPRPSPGSRSR